ncbi:unnamed protein product, partial [Iphiclides podalirius]
MSIGHFVKLGGGRPAELNDRSDRNYAAPDTGRKQGLRYGPRRVKEEKKSIPPLTLELHEDEFRDAIKSATEQRLAAEFGLFMTLGSVSRTNYANAHL